MTSDVSDDPAVLPRDLRFLAGGGEAARLILSSDWAAHPLGDPAGWSDILKSNLSTVLNSPESMILAWGSDALTFFFNDAYIPLLGPRVSWAMGAPFEVVWADGWAQAKPIIDEAFAGRPKRFTDMPWKLDTDRGRADTWFTFSYSRILDAQGAIAGLFILTNETTERVLADSALRQSEERLRLVIEGAKDHVIFTADHAGIITSWSAGAQAVLGWTPQEAIGQPAAITFTQEDRAAGMDVGEFADAVRDGGAGDERWHVRKDGSRVFLNGSVHPLPANPVGERRGFIKIARDETARWQVQQQRELLHQELAHRLKNVLTLVQAIASQTLRQAVSLEVANTDFTARIVALGKAADVLTARAWQTATLPQVVEAGLTSVAGRRERIQVSGPPIVLKSQVAMAMTLAFHELATNAAKYGALSNDMGTIDLDWRIVETKGDEPRLCLRWQETGGPPVAPPSRRGFGSRMIERALRAYFRGEMALSFEPAGVVFVIDAPLNEAGAELDALVAANA